MSDEEKIVPHQGQPELQVNIAEKNDGCDLSDIIGDLYLSRKDDGEAKEREWRETLVIEEEFDDDDEVFVTSNTQVSGITISKRRCYSECSDDSRPASDGSVQSNRERITFRRDRSRSEPAVPASVDVVSIARELRRVSDEFHSLYTATVPKTRPSSGGSPYSGAGRRLLENVCDHMLGNQLRPIPRQRSYSENAPSTSYNF